MVLEATVLVIDNSEWSRNGDYMPTRYQAQIDAVRYLFGIKTNDNPENTVGVIANAGDSPQVLVSLTGDHGVLLKGMHGLGIRGEAHFDIGIQIAQLVLKHRANKYQKQRIITFAASPIDADEKALVRLGKKLKKNGVSIDVVSFGENAANEQKLAAFVEAVNNNDTSHLLVVPPGPHVLSEQIRASPIVGGGGAGGGGADNDDFEFGVDPDMDPELALALQMSMREEEERQLREAASQQSAGGGSAGQQAAAGGGDSMMDMDDDEDIKRAIQMSLEEGGQGSDAGPAADAENDDLVASLVGSLPGVDANDPALQSALGSRRERGEDADAKGKDKDKSKKA
ncbi:proteasome regulatory particle base subunit rpn10 [Coemansia biformis]|uniref:Proteasome regulatory particle base subunit rpn10 n=1 Tax=Coemansia biformis TaxID=1286918 RepID=A0A9W7Y7E3_9FUNG|nr:proteasome regulatory particle base subunit rpn10 [Coemansia biformis]